MLATVLVLAGPHAKDYRGRVPPTARQALASVLSGLSLPDGGMPTRPEFGGGKVIHRGVTATDEHGCKPARDLRSGELDRRAATVLRKAGDRWRVRVSCVRTGHSRYVRGTSRVSNHTAWRAFDLDRVNGRPVGPGNRDARALARWLGRLPAPLRPSEIGQPWRSDGPYFTDDGHQHHIHVGWSR
jgi:hypothetical protein